MPTLEPDLIYEQTRNKVTHVYEIMKAYGSTSQVTFNRDSGQWQRKDSIAAKHGWEISVNPFNGAKWWGVRHAPLVYPEDPRNDLPRTLQKKLGFHLIDADDRILAGWLGFTDD